MKIVIVTGMLAAGKSIALRVFEDLAYYCIDNIPPLLIEDFISLAEKIEPPIEKIAFVVDVRVQGFFKELEKYLSKLKEERQCELLYIDAEDEVLIQRYKLSRRKHLMAKNERVEQTIKKEREMLEPLKAISDHFIDTSHIKEKTLKKKILEIYSPSKSSVTMQVNIVSFGFKYGILKDADMVLDARFLPNPYYIENLKYKSGLQSEVQDYVMSFEESQTFLEKSTDMIKFLLDYYAREEKSQLVIGIGCSGGRHRSVSFAEKLVLELQGLAYSVGIEHRDIDKDVY